MKRLLVFIFILLLASPTSAQTAGLKGQVSDSTGGVIIGATVKVFSGERAIAEAKTAGRGDFEIPLDPGDYRIEVTAPEFDPHREIVRVSPDMGPLAISLNLAAITHNVEVKTDRSLISLEPDNNLTSTVLGKDFIENLPDDEEELAQILREMAGPRAGAGGGAEFIIDGFSGGGRLPPKDQIQEIRINNNPFTTEYSRPGFGRMEIITRAGMGAFRGNLMFNFSDEALNARNAFASFKPAYQQRNFHTSVSGPLIRNRLSIALFGMQNEQDGSDTIRAITLDGPFSTAIVRPNVRRHFNARGQYQILENHSMNFNVQYGTNERKNQGVGGFSLPERASDSRSRDMGFQVRETSVLSKTLIHETRFEFRRDTSRTRPRTDGVAITVLDAFQAGGAQNRSEDTNRNYEFGNMLMFSSSKLTLKTGFQGDYRQSRSSTENNFRGTFVFSSLADFREGRPLTFTMNRGDPQLDVNQFEMGAFIQNDLRVTRNFSLSFGVRYETQTNLSDRNNFDPRAGFAYAIGRSTAIRGGIGVFHQRFNTNLVGSLLRLDGTRQEQIVVRNPSYPNPFESGFFQLIPPASARLRAEDLATPYTVNSSVSLEKSLPHGLVLTASYDFIRGVHLYRSRNLNAPLPGQTERPDSNRGNVLHMESTGTSDFHGLTVGFRQRLGNRLNYFGNYTYSSAYNDVDGPFGLPASSYDLRAEWGRSGDHQKQRVFTGVNLSLPWGLNVNTMVQANTGRPFNITTGFDDNHDTTVNDRPAGVRRNSRAGPGQFNVNLNLSKTIRLKSAAGSQPGPGGSFVQPQHGPPAGGPVFVGPGQMPPGGMGRGGPGGMGGRPGMGGPGGRPGAFQRETGPTMAFFVNMQNALNHINLSSFSGVLTSPFFGRANSARNPRKIEVGMRFNF